MIHMILLSGLHSLKAMLMWGSGGARLNYHKSHIRRRRMMQIWGGCCVSCGNASKRKQLKAAALRAMGVSKGWKEAKLYPKSRVFSHVIHEKCTCLSLEICHTIYLWISRDK